MCLLQTEARRKTDINGCKINQKNLTLLNIKGKFEFQLKDGMKKTEIKDTPEKEKRAPRGKASTTKKRGGGVSSDTKSEGEEVSVSASSAKKSSAANRSTKRTSDKTTTKRTKETKTVNHAKQNKAQDDTLALSDEKTEKNISEITEAVPETDIKQSSDVSQATTDKQDISKEDSQTEKETESEDSSQVSVREEKPIRKTAVKNKKPLRIRAYKVVRKILVGFILVGIVNFVFSYFFHTPKVYSLGHRNTELLMQYRMLQDKVDLANEKLNEIESRNNGIYRSIFALDTIPSISDENPLDYANIKLFEHNRYGSVMSYAAGSVDLLAEKLYRQSVSLDTVQIMARDKGRMTEAIPAIWPLDRNRIRNIGAFGNRVHPIFKTVKRHTGVDFSGEMNTPIYATADGVVIKSTVESGYGKSVVIDHGYGYQTRYAHLNKSLVKVGQQVKRGEKIALMGNTGRSTGTHLHYEVIYRGVHVNPLSYVSRDMSDEDFRRIIESAKNVIYEQD